MTYTAVNPHACCNWPRPEDAHTAARPPQRLLNQVPINNIISLHPHASPHLTNNDGLRWKTDGQPPVNGPPTTAPQQRRHSPSTPARGLPRPPIPPTAHSRRHHQAKDKVRSPLQNRMMFYVLGEVKEGCEEEVVPSVPQFQG